MIKGPAIVVLFPLPQVYSHGHEIQVPERFVTLPPLSCVELNTDNIPTDEQVNQFLEHGYLVIKAAFTQEKAEEWTQNIWIRLGLDPKDKSTWDRERIHMPSHRREEVVSFAPKVSIISLFRRYIGFPSTGMGRNTRSSGRDREDR